jgi:hypothetical protein
MGCPKLWCHLTRNKYWWEEKKLGDKSQDDQVEHLRSYTTSFKEANWKKMIKRKMSNKNQTNDVSVVCKGRSYLVYNQN